MSMNLAKQTFSTEPEYLIAGLSIGITTATKEASVDIKKGAPVALAEGKAALMTAADTAGLYGIAAEDAAAGEEAIIYLSGEFFADALALESGVTAADIEVALRNIGIFLK